MVVVVDVIVVEVVVLVARVLVVVLLVVVVGRLVVVVVDVVGGNVTVVVVVEVVVVLVVVVGSRVVVVVLGGAVVVVVVGGRVVVVGGGTVVLVGGRDVVVVVGVTTGRLQVQVTWSHNSPPEQPMPVSHCSPAPRSTMPSPQMECPALKLALTLDRGALRVPFITSQAGSIVAVSFALPCRPVHERQVTLTFVPRAIALSFAFVAAHTLPKETCLPLITIGSGAESPGSNAAPCTK